MSNYCFGSSISHFCILDFLITLILLLTCARIIWLKEEKTKYTSIFIKQPTRCPRKTEVLPSSKGTFFLGYPVDCWFIAKLSCKILLTFFSFDIFDFGLRKGKESTVFLCLTYPVILTLNPFVLSGWSVWKNWPQMSQKNIWPRISGWPDMETDYI